LVSKVVDARNRRVAPVCGVEDLGRETPCRVGAVIAERSGAAAKALDGVGAIRAPADGMRALLALSRQC
jgi:hypothetical protein